MDVSTEDNDIICDNSQPNAEHTDIQINDFLLNDRYMIDLIKENMLQERKWHAEIVALLKGQISFLETEVIYKNTLIKNLIIELSTRSQNDSTSTATSDNKSTSTATPDNNSSNLSSWSESPRTHTVNSRNDNWKHKTPVVPKNYKQGYFESSRFR